MIYYRERQKGISAQGTHVGMYDEAWYMHGLLIGLSSGQGTPWAVADKLYIVRKGTKTLMNPATEAQLRKLIPLLFKLEISE